MHAEPSRTNACHAALWNSFHEAAPGIKPARACENAARVAEPAGDDRPARERPGRQRDVRRDAAQDDDAALQQEDRDVQLEDVPGTAERLDQHG